MSLVLTIDTPMLSIDEYARRTGVTPESVKKQMDRRQLPFIQPETRGTRYVNMLHLFKYCDEYNHDKPHNRLGQLTYREYA